MRTEGVRGRVAALASIAIAMAALVAGCPGTLGDERRFLVDGGAGGSALPCPDVPAVIFAASCAGSGCHGSTNPVMGLDLESTGLSARVVGKAATECSGVLADPAHPTDSVLYAKLLPAPPCGVRMPAGGRAPLSAEQTACVAQWIAAQPAPAPESDGGSGGASGTGGAGGAGTGGAGGAGTGGAGGAGTGGAHGTGSGGADAGG